MTASRQWPVADHQLPVVNGPNKLPWALINCPRSIFGSFITNWFQTQTQND